MPHVTIPGSEFAELSAEILGRGVSLRFEAHGQSMATFVRDGDILTIEPVPAVALRRAEVAFYRTAAGAMAAHRVVGRRVQAGQVVVLTRGDAVLGPADRVPAGRVLGRVVTLDRGGRMICLDHRGRKFAPILWIGLYPAGPILLQLARAGNRGALWLTGRLQALKLYRIMARRLFGRRSTCRAAMATDASPLASLHDPRAPADPGDPSGIVARHLKQVRGCGHTLVACVGRKVVGAAIITPVPGRADLYPDWWLFGLLVRTRYRGAGIGERLVRLALEEAAAEGASTVYLWVPEGNRPATRLFNKMGFQPASRPDLEARWEKQRLPGQPHPLLMARTLKADI